MFFGKYISFIAAPDVAGIQQAADGTPRAIIRYVACENKYLAAISETSKSVSITPITQTNWRTKAFAQPETSVLKSVYFSPDGSTFVVLFTQTLFLCDTNSMDIISSHMIPAGKNSNFVDIIYKNDFIYALLDKGGIITLNTKLCKISECDFNAESSCFSMYKDSFIVGTKKGRIVILDKKAEKLEKVNEFRASACEIEVAAMNDDVIYVSSRSDTVFWSKDLIPLYSVKNMHCAIHPDINLEFGVSIVKDPTKENDVLYLHKLVKGSKEETIKPFQFEIDSELLEQPDFTFSENGRMRLIFGSPQNIYICFIN